MRDATLTLLYRLLFILYAEDRELLPVRDERYNDYGLRMRVRDDVRTRKDRNDVFSATATRYWTAIDDLAAAIDRGDASIGLPPYNGGLFNRERTPLLANVRLGDEVLADVIDTMSFERAAGGRRYINYRDLSVQQLGSIYERLLERELVRDGETVVVRPNVFARKGSGSYFTPHELVNLILEETVGPLVLARLDDFARASEDLTTRRLTREDRIATLERLDPAERVLDLRICDPAMGSGHFLVGLVDYLADRVISLMAEAEAMAEGYASPLTRRIDDVRRTIIDNARERDWTVDPDRLDDRHLVRRIVLKRCVYGVDRNPMAVELAKVSLWLHTFTAGAPLSFLDHHLRCGNSLFGCWARSAFDTANRLGSPLFLHEPLNRAFYSLFVERAFALVSPEGVVGLLIPSGIASDKTSAGFFRRVATEGRLRALYDFENRKVFFPDVHASFKFCVFVTGRSPAPEPAKCAFYLHGLAELSDPDRRFPLTAADFRNVNPNTGTAPIFRSRRDASLTTAIYGRLPVLVDRSSNPETKAWPVRYERMFDMTNDSGLFRTRAELEDQEGAWPSGGNRFDSPTGEWLPLYEGKMVQAFDQRAARIVVSPANLHRPAQPEPATEEQHRDANWLPEPQYWVNEREIEQNVGQWWLGWKGGMNAAIMVLAFVGAVTSFTSTA